MSVDPRAVKDTLVSREVSALRNLGREVHLRAVEESVETVMARNYARKREEKRQAKALKKAIKKNRVNPAAALAAAEGLAFTRRAARTATPGLMSLEALLGPSPRCRLRVTEIVRRAKQGETRFRPMWDELVYASTRLQTGVGHVFHLSHTDRWRVFTAELEKICDSTTGILGEWR